MSSREPAEQIIVRVDDTTARRMRVARTAARRGRGVKAGGGYCYGGGSNEPVGV